MKRPFRLYVGKRLSDTLDDFGDLHYHASYANADRAVLRAIRYVDGTPWREAAVMWDERDGAYVARSDVRGRVVDPLPASTGWGARMIELLRDSQHAKSRGERNREIAAGAEV